MTTDTDRANEVSTKTKLPELLRGERDWDKLDMARECLEAIERLDAEAERYWQRINGIG